MSRGPKQSYLEYVEIVHNFAAYQSALIAASQTARARFAKEYGFKVNELPVKEHSKE